MKKICYLISIFLLLTNFQFCFAQDKTEDNNVAITSKNTPIVNSVKNEDKILNANITYALEKKILI